MFDLNSLYDYLGMWSGMISSIIVIGGAFMWIAKKFYLDPKDKRKEEQDLKYQQRMIEIAQEQNAPFKDSIDSLNESVGALNSLLEDSQRDRKVLHEIADENTRKIGELDDKSENHEVRISVLESHTGIKKLNYKEVYGKEKDY